MNRLAQQKGDRQLCKSIRDLTMTAFAWNRQRQACLRRGLPFQDHLQNLCSTSKRIYWTVCRSLISHSRNPSFMPAITFVPVASPWWLTMHVQCIIDHTCVYIYIYIYIAYNHASATRAFSYILLWIWSPSFTEPIISYAFTYRYWSSIHLSQCTVHLYVQSRHHQISGP